MRRCIFILGGARSGKSSFAEDLGLRHGGPRIYLATAEPGDEEMRVRIAQHRQRRGDRWRTIEEPLRLAEVLRREAAGGRFVLVDCITLWISNLMHAGRDVAGSVDGLIEALPALEATVAVVSNEVGLGIVPENALARRFRDEAGSANRRIADIADEAVLMAAGLPIRLKG